MEQNEIDKLEGRELNAAVRIALMKRGTPADHHDSYSESIERALELDGDEWRWQGWEGNGFVTVRVIIDSLKAQDFFGSAKVESEKSKAAAYATARCRCWLKAQQAEADNA